MSSDEKNATAHYMTGKWNSKGDKTDITVEISAKTIIISGKVNDEAIDVTFSNSNWWVGDYLFFTSDPRFYLQYANKTHLGFGELVVPGLVGEKKWGFKFDRVE
ncbi:MAG: hypothetical protein JWP12_2482 [Bacteroidetes bacterium]|nr:hypothetical protein [Bacteroidota bacterium]